MLYARLQRLELLAEKFNLKAQKVENWTSGKIDELNRNEDIEAANLADIQVKLFNIVN